MSCHNRVGLAFLLHTAVLAAAPAGAAPVLDRPFTDHAVLQRGRPIRIAGQAVPGESVRISLAGRSVTARAGADGRWLAALPAARAGGPYTLEAQGSRGTPPVRASDVMIGDVWLCSGQSNMEFSLSRSLNGAGEVQQVGDPLLRLMTVPQRASIDPTPFPSEVKWEPATSASAADFSAACTFMGQRLRAANGVAVGLIDASWGGTAIRSWISEDAMRASGGGADADLLALHRRDPAAAARQYGEQWAAWWRGQTHDAVGAEPWHASDRLKWQPLPSFTYWENWGRPDFANFNGAVWARRRVTLDKAQVRQAATLSLGVIDDADTTFVNGVLVGSTTSWSQERRYPLAPGVLRVGSNEIVVLVRDSYGFGGFRGPAEVIKLGFVGGPMLPLGSKWEISVAPSNIGEPPPAPWDGQGGVATLYHGMVQPLGALGLAGVAWYQGEADVGKPGYDRRLAALMRTWREQVGQPDLPFIIVGLAGFGKRVATPQNSDWARVINEQRRAVEGDRFAALASAIDLGEPGDIHPSNKQEVGRRLALGARALAGDPGGRIGPRPLGAERAGGKVTVRFSKPIQSIGGVQVLGVELCGAGPRSCRFAAATVRGVTLTIAGDGRAVTRVRHAWADSPIVNLYDADGLPVPVFELSVH